MLLHIFLCSNTHEHTNAPNGKHQGHAVCSRISPQRYSRLEPSGQSLAQVRINLMPYGLQDCSSGSNHSYQSSHSQARDFSLARYSRIAQVLIDKEVVFSTSLQHFLKPSLGCASLNLWAFSPSAPATSLELKPLPSGFHRSRGCGAFGFLFPPPPAACFRFAAGRGAFVVGACAPHLLCI